MSWWFGGIDKKSEALQCPHVTKYLVELPSMPCGTYTSRSCFLLLSPYLMWTNRTDLLTIHFHPKRCIYCKLSIRTRGISRKIIQSSFSEINGVTVPNQSQYLSEVMGPSSLLLKIYNSFNEWTQWVLSMVSPGWADTICIWINIFSTHKRDI